ncbi:MAG: hypothetical protein ACO1NO_06300 [Burkholderiaceae bacterium]
MFKYKNALISAAVVAMLAACGGGGGGDDDDNGGTGGTGGGTVISDTNLAGGTVSLADDFQILVPNGAAVFPVTYPDFNSTTPRDAASGNEGGYGTWTGAHQGTASPLAFFGVRVDDVTADDVAEVPADATATGRLVFQLQDNAAVAAAQRESLSIEIDNITTTRTGGELFVTLGEGAQVHVAARNGAGAESGVVSFPATAAMFTVTDNDGSNDIVLNVDTIVAEAITAAGATGNASTVLTSVRDFGSTITEPFAVSMTLTNVDFAVAGTATTGASNVKVGTRDAVSGEGGVTGFVQQAGPGTEGTGGTDGGTGGTDGGTGGTDGGTGGTDGGTGGTDGGTGGTGTGA